MCGAWCLRFGLRLMEWGGLLPLSCCHLPQFLSQFAQLTVGYEGHLHLAVYFEIDAHKWCVAQFGQLSLYVLLLWLLCLLIFVICLCLIPVLVFVSHTQHQSVVAHPQRHSHLYLAFCRGFAQQRFESLVVVAIQHSAWLQVFRHVQRKQSVALSTVYAKSHNLLIIVEETQSVAIAERHRCCHIE